MGSSVTMSYSWSGSYEYGYVAGVFRAANMATPTATPTATKTPTITPTVPSSPSGQIWKSYYFAGSQRVAMRVAGDPVSANNGVFYILGDHLGSTSLVVNSSGIAVGELRYRAWGDTRVSTGTLGMDYRYTGQRQENADTLGLYYYNARWYDPGLGRFAQADTVAAGNGPVSWDRYAYVMNNPVLRVDPSGHVCSDPEDPTPSCDSGVNWRPARTHSVTSDNATDDQIGPGATKVNISDTWGLCVPYVGCSGGLNYKKWWSDWYFPRLPSFLASDIASANPYLDPTLKLVGGLADYAEEFGLLRNLRLGGGFEATLQLFRDAPRRNLTTSQFLGRAIVAGIEGTMISSAAAGVGGDLAALTLVSAPATSAAAPVAWVLAFGGGYIATTAFLSTAFATWNASLFPFFGLGEP